MPSPLDDDNNSTRGVGLPELQRRAISAAIAEGMHTGAPCRVERYDASIQQVDVKILVKDFHRDETGALVVSSVPVITNLPVKFPSGGGYRLVFPIHVGDLGWVGPSERSIDRWLSGDGSEVDPEIYTRFNLTDFGFYPGGRPFGAPLGDVPVDRLAIGHDGGIQIQITDEGQILVGGPTATEQAVLGTTFRTLETVKDTEMIAQFNAMASDPILALLCPVADASATALATAVQTYETNIAAVQDGLSDTVKIGL